jgi:hypothetical protein
MRISSGPSAIVDLSCVGGGKLRERSEDANLAVSAVEVQNAN